MKKILIACTLFMAGCSTTKNVRTLQADIASQKLSLQEISKKIDAVNNQRMLKIDAGELDETTDSITKIYIQELKDSVAAKLAFYDALVSTKQIRRQKKQIFAYLNEAKKSYDKGLSNVYFLDDLFKASTFNRLNMATFFGPGEYELTDSAKAMVSGVLQNIIIQALSFSNLHSTQKLRAMFIVLGYADEGTISPGSPLYADLISGFEDKQPTSKRLNLELSARRASSIKKITKAVYEKMASSNFTAIDAQFIATGKGEALPSGSIKDYKAVDERRRVVLIYWSILPDLKN